MNFIKYFTLRRTTMIVVYFLLTIINAIVFNILFNEIPWFTQILVGVTSGWYITEFTDWNYKQNDYEIIRDIQS